MTDRVCAHVVGTDYAALDDFTVSRIKTRVLDAIGVIAAGVHAPMCDELFDLLKSYGAAKQSAAFFRGERIDAPSAAMINSFSMRSYDFEAIEAENEAKTGVRKMAGKIEEAGTKVKNAAKEGMTKAAHKVKETATQASNRIKEKVH